MPNLKSAEKRDKITERNKIKNRFIKNSVKTLTKIILKKNLIITAKRFENSKNQENQKEQIRTLLYLIISLIDKGTKKNIFHKKKAARKKKIFSELLLKHKFIKNDSDDDDNSCPCPVILCNDHDSFCNDDECYHYN